MCGRIQDSVCVAEHRIVCVAEYRTQEYSVCGGRIQACVCGRTQDSVCVAEYRIVCVWQNTG